MKANIYVLLLFLTGVLLTSCKKSDIAYENDFNTSVRYWMNFKTASGNSYRYVVNFSSWAGFSTETVITVKEGKVVQRSYTATRRIDSLPGQSEVYEQWTEDESKVGSHGAAYPPQTLDEIYKAAKDQWLLKRSNAQTYFETKNNGMISSCGFVENGCMDDCFRGINISLIEKI
ncbi:hypothetical protein FHW36_103584 [Chitinophaga polysaccharea]|uniref:Lipoprotein n=1 Tax=Chitinophaga polysaccharea TaxID=1293035 RepID=A0A561PUK1_9BACT|nr:hypothetical protein [Chitinophaga polysaccharea]TWF41780.1 hypothetical protein FHW36_103584 [Chitinophaga polysaccharea]